MKILPVLLSVSLLVGLSNPAFAGKKKKHHHKSPVSTDDTAKVESSDKPDLGSTDDKDNSTDDKSFDDKSAVDKPAEKKPAGGKKPLDFDFFGDKTGAAGADLSGGEHSDLTSEEAEQKSQTRRWMLKTHQTLGIATWLLMAGTVTIGQLNYNQLYGGGGGNTKWQTYHQIGVLSTSVAFAATAAFAIFAPTPYKKPMRFDTGLVHRIAVIGATLGMVTEGLLGWWTTHQANAGNPNRLRTMAQVHQIVGYSTFGLLTIAGTVWLF